MPVTKNLTKEQAHIIKVITFGSILEWYEIYSFAYLAPVLGKLFFNFHSSMNNLLGALLLFGIGFISRPFGAILFGRIGDLIGRKTAFTYSIVIMTIPTFLMGCLPTYSSLGILAPILFYLLRFMQSIPASGEIPGAICFLYENASKKNIKYITSWALVGNQIGAILGIIEIVLIDYFLSESSIMAWGWRLSFWSGGFLGLFGIYLRRTLIETPIFKDLKSHHHVDKETVMEVINTKKKPILLGTAFGTMNAVIFYLFASYIPGFVEEYISITSTNLLLSMIALLIPMTALIPFFGKLADKFSSKKILVYSSIFVILLLLPLYIAVNNKNVIQLISVGILFSIPIASTTALYPYWIAHIFHSKIRYTAVGLAFNFADGIMGGLSPAIALAILELTKNAGAFCWYVLLCSIITMISYLRIREKNSYST